MQNPREIQERVPDTRNFWISIYGTWPDWTNRHHRLADSPQDTSRTLAQTYGYNSSTLLATGVGPPRRGPARVF